MDLLGAKGGYTATLDLLCDRQECFQITEAPERREG
jgi:hypothetical protein